MACSRLVNDIVTIMGDMNDKTNKLNRHPIARSPLLNMKLTIFMLLAILCPVSFGLDCFICQSRNGSNPYCEDPFHNLNSVKISTPLLPSPRPRVIYHAPCFTARKNRDGVFPASACIKMSGVFANGETIVVRHCGLDSGTLNSDTELVRMSHCGKFQLDGKILHGCVSACGTDACNGATSSQNINIGFFVITIMISLIWIQRSQALDHRQL